MILDRLAEELSDLAVIEQRPIQDGRNMTMMLGPSKAVLSGEIDSGSEEPAPDADVEGAEAAPDDGASAAAPAADAEPAAAADAAPSPAPPASSAPIDGDPAKI
jgi:translation initiation factor IF-3